MTHFAVLVHIPASRLGEAPLEEVVRAMLAPFEVDTKDRRFLVFEDLEEQRRHDYETELLDVIRAPDGTLRMLWDRMYSGPEGIAVGDGTGPEEHVQVEVTMNRYYPTLDDYLRGWRDEERDPETGRFGEWHNPNGKWGWWRIGGRWSGFFPTRQGNVDVARVADIDQAEVSRRWERWMANFHREYQELLVGRQFPWDEGPRRRALELGLLRVEQGPATAGPGEVVLPWKDRESVSHDRRGWNDVARSLTLDELRATYGVDFHPLTALVVLNEQGWHAPGSIGWLAYVDADLDTKLAFQRQIIELFLPSLDPADTLVVVDCHT